MGVGNMFVLVQATLYLLILIFSFFTLIPLSVYNTQFSGHCLLYARGDWSFDNKTSEPVLKVNWGDEGYCSFPIFMSAVALPSSLFYLVVLSIHLYKDTNVSWMGTFVMVILNWLYVGLTFVSGIIIAEGFNQWCSLLDKMSIDCDAGEFVNFEIEKDITKTGYYVEFEMAKAVIWMSWICWTILAGMASYKLYQFHRQEDFFTSMRRERQRLISRSASSQQEAIYT